MKRPPSAYRTCHLLREDFRPLHAQVVYIFFYMVMCVICVGPEFEFDAVISLYFVCMKPLHLFHI